MSKRGPPGWLPHKIDHRLDGWVCDPESEDRIPAAVAEMIARAMPQPDEVEIILARMMARHRMIDRGYSDE
jgi:hypothetical protein